MCYLFVYWNNPALCRVFYDEVNGKKTIHDVFTL